MGLGLGAAGAAPRAAAAPGPTPGAAPGTAPGGTHAAGDPCGPIDLDGVLKYSPSPQPGEEYW